jgi:UPF0042 nucleotide-binding protein
MMTDGGHNRSGAVNEGNSGRVLIVTGMSRAGRCAALKTLEDTRYEAFDNLPLSLLPALLQSVAGDAGAIAVGACLRMCGFAIGNVLDSLDESLGWTARELKIPFIDCDDERLQQRYTETRCPHPLAGDRPCWTGSGWDAQVYIPCKTALIS